MQNIPCHSYFSHIAIATWCAGTFLPCLDTEQQSSGIVNCKHTFMQEKMASLLFSDAVNRNPEAEHVAERKLLMEQKYLYVY